MWYPNVFRCGTCTTEWADFDLSGIVSNFQVECELYKLELVVRLKGQQRATYYHTRPWTALDQMSSKDPCYIK